MPGYPGQKFLDTGSRSATILGRPGPFDDGFTWSDRYRDVAVGNGHICHAVIHGCCFSQVSIDHGIQAFIAFDGHITGTGDDRGHCPDDHGDRKRAVGGTVSVIVCRIDHDHDRPHAIVGRGAETIQTGTNPSVASNAETVMGSPTGPLIRASEIFVAGHRRGHQSTTDKGSVCIIAIRAGTLGLDGFAMHQTGTTLP